MISTALARFHWDYSDEVIRDTGPARAGTVSGSVLCTCACTGCSLPASYKHAQEQPWHGAGAGAARQAHARAGEGVWRTLQKSMAINRSRWCGLSGRRGCNPRQLGDRRPRLPASELPLAEQRLLPPCARSRVRQKEALGGAGQKKTACGAGPRAAASRQTGASCGLRRRLAYRTQASQPQPARLPRVERSLAALKLKFDATRSARALRCARGLTGEHTTERWSRQCAPRPCLSDAFLPKSGPAHGGRGGGGRARVLRGPPISQDREKTQGNSENSAPKKERKRGLHQACCLLATLHSLPRSA